MAKLFATTTALAAVLITSGCMGYVADAYSPPPPRPGPIAIERTDLDEPGYRVAPKPNPHRLASKTSSTHHGREAAGDSKKTETTAQEKTEAPSERTADAKPLTPAEIRGAIPLQKVGNPEQTLFSAQIKNVWGDAIGRVRAVSVSGGTLKAVEADVGAKKVVRIDPARLRYVKSRNVILTTMSKPDVEKLPSASKL